MEMIKRKELADLPNGWTIKTTPYGKDNSRIKATCGKTGDGQGNWKEWSKIVAYDSSLSTLGCHVKAVHALVNSDKWVYHDSEQEYKCEIISWGANWEGYTFIVRLTTGE
jgi:hypothetical protein